MTATQTQPWKLALGGMLAMAGAMGIGRFIYTPILPPMAEGLALSGGQAGLIASANFLGYLAGALAAAASRLPGGARGWMLASLAVSAATTGIMGTVDGMAVFLTLRFVGGAASAFVLVLASSLVLERLAEAGRGGLSAMHFAGVGVGIAASALLTWGIDSGLTASVSGNGWRWMWIGGGIVTATAFCAVAMLVPGMREERAAQRTTNGATSLIRLWPLVTAYGLFGFGYVITATFIVAIVRGAPELRAIEPFVWLVVGLAGAPSVAVWAAVGRRFGVVRAFGIACLVEAAGVTASVVWISLPGLFVAAVFLGGTFIGITALGLVAARSLTAGNPRRALAIMTAAFGLGQTVGPVVAGYGYDLTGSYLLPSLFAAAALVVAWGLSGMVRRG